MAIFKKAQVKLLATKESDIVLNDKNQLVWMNVPLIYNEGIPLFPRHIFIINDDEIKEGDLFIALDGTDDIILADKIYLDIIEKDKKNNIDISKKIIATTDKSLELPTVSDHFIAYYIEAYNRAKPITDVLVEYENDTLRLFGNAIFAKTPKNSWNREEVYDIFNEYLNYLIDPNSNKQLTGKEWLDQNL